MSHFQYPWPAHASERRPRVVQFHHAGAARQTCPFYYVDDMIDGLDRLMCNSRDRCSPVNLGNPVECTMLDLAEKIIAITGSHSPIVFHPLPSDDPGRRCPDIALAKSLFGWQPKVDLEEGLRRTVDYFRRPSSTLGANQHTRIGMTNSSLSQAARP